MGRHTEKCLKIKFSHEPERIWKKGKLSNKTQHLCIAPLKRKCGLNRTFLISLRLILIGAQILQSMVIGRPTLRISMSWIALYGRTLQSKACSKPHNSIEALKASLVKEWDEVPQEMIQKAIDNFPKRLKKCIEANGGQFDE